MRQCAGMPVLHTNSFGRNRQLFTIVYAVVMTGAVTWLFGKRLAVLKFIALKCEADLRFALVRVRENAESIAMFSGGPRELCTARSLLGALVKNRQASIWVMFGYESFQNATQYITGIILIILRSVRPP